MTDYLSAQEVCDIIRASGTAGVTELKFRDLQVSFLPKLDEIHLNRWAPTTPPFSDTAISEANNEQDQRERLQEDERALREQQLAEMPIVDPLAYEQLLASGELEDEETYRARTQ